MIKIHSLKKGILTPTLLIVFFAMLGSMIFAGESNFYHKYLMRGSIVDSDDGKIYLCIGSKDGAQVGQELVVYHITVIRNANTKVPPTFKREKIGSIRISEIVDEHFAWAKIISGKANTNDIVELEKAGK